MFADDRRVTGMQFLKTDKPLYSGQQVPQRSQLFKFAKNIKGNRDESVILDEVLKKFKDKEHVGGILQLPYLFLRVTKDQDPYFRCRKCGRVHLHRGAKICTRCFMALSEQPTGSVEELWKIHFLAKKIKRNANWHGGFRLHCEELTGQTGSPSERLQSFKGIFINSDRSPEKELEKKASEIDLLAVTTTMEVGVDIGALQAIFQGNMPPQRFNYQQRVGRAGRRGQAFSFILTLCRNQSHDLHYFHVPDKIVSDPPPPPFLTCEHLEIPQRIINKAWFSAAFAAYRTDCQDAGIPYPGDKEQDIHGEFPSTKMVYTKMLSSNILRNLLVRTKAERDETIDVLSMGNSSLCPRLQDACTVDTLLNDLMSLSDEAQYSPLPFAQFMAENGLLPLYGMPTNVRPLYLGVKGEELSDPTFIEIDRDAERAIYEFAPGQHIVKDKRTYETIGFSPTQWFPSGRARTAKALGEWSSQARYIAKCEACQSYSTYAAKESVSCGMCQTPIGAEILERYDTPRVFLANFMPLDNRIAASQQPLYFNVTTTLEHKPADTEIIPGTSLSMGKSQGNTHVLRLNDGRINDIHAKNGGFSMTVFGKYQMQSWSLPNVLIDTKRHSGSQQLVRLMARKKTDALFLTPYADIPHLDIGRIGRLATETDVRAAVLSATQLLVLRASLEFDIAPDEFEMLEPRLWDGRPMLQIADSLPNGAGFSRRLARLSERTGLPLVVELIRSMVESPADDPLMANIVQAEHMKNCKTSCYDCMQRYGNRMYHGLLDWRLGISFLALLLDAEWRVGLDGNWNFYAITDWQGHAKSLANNLTRIRPDVSKYIELSYSNFSLHGLEQDEDIYLIVHPFWNKKHIFESMNSNKKIHFISSFEALRRPLKAMENPAFNG